MDADIIFAETQYPEEITVLRKPWEKRKGIVIK